MRANLYLLNFAKRSQLSQMTSGIRAGSWVKTASCRFEHERVERRTPQRRARTLEDEGTHNESEDCRQKDQHGFFRRRNDRRH